MHRQTHQKKIHPWNKRIRPSTFFFSQVISSASLTTHEEQVVQVILNPTLHLRKHMLFNRKLNLGVYSICYAWHLSLLLLISKCVTTLLDLKFLTIFGWNIYLHLCHILHSLRLENSCSSLILTSRKMIIIL